MHLKFRRNTLIKSTQYGVQHKQFMSAPQAITEHQRALESFMKQEEENSLKASNRHDLFDINFTVEP